jgi:hypothetical protein
LASSILGTYEPEVRGPAAEVPDDLVSLLLELAEDRRSAAGVNRM